MHTIRAHKSVVDHGDNIRFGIVIYGSSNRRELQSQT
jgi:hypothetical protein